MEDIQELIDKVQDRDIKVLLKAKHDAQVQVVQDPSVTNIKAFNAASKSLDEMMKKINSASNPDQAVLGTIPKVAEYLQSKGWKVSQSSIYSHHEQGRLKKNKDGVFLIKDVDVYAKENLDRLDGSESDKSTESLQDQIKKAELNKMKAQAEHWKLKTEIESGRYVERASFERELAARATVFKSDMQNFFRSRASEIVGIVDGQETKIPDLIDYLLDQGEIWLGRYSENREFKTDGSSSDSL